MLQTLSLNSLSLTAISRLTRKTLMDFGARRRSPRRRQRVGSTARMQRVLLVLVLVLLATPSCGRKSKKAKQKDGGQKVLRRLQGKLAALESLPACQLPRVDARAVSLEEFRKSIQERGAVLIDHGTPEWADAMQSWNAENTTAHHGEEIIAIQDPELLVKRGSFAPVIGRRQLGEYVENMEAEPNPVFWNRWMQVTDALVADLASSGHAFDHLPTRSLRFHHIFSLGGVGTGVGFHAHSENWLGQVAGRKAWFVAPPGPNSKGTDWEKKHGCEWLLGDPSAAAQDPRIKSCIVEPGQAIYIPTGWHHATCNMDEFTLSLGGQGDVGDASDVATANRRLLLNPASSCHVDIRVLDNNAKGVAAALADTTADHTAGLHTGQQPWHLAVMHNRVESLRLMAAAGLDITSPMHCEYDSVPEYRAQSHFSKLKTCMLLGGSPWFRGSGIHGIANLYLATQCFSRVDRFFSCGSTGCFHNCTDGLLDVVKFYVEEVGTPINEKMAVGDDNKPVGTVNIAHVACVYAESAIMDYALSKNPRLLNHADPSNRLPLQWCAFQGNADMVEAMLEHTTLQQLQHKDSSGNDAEGLSQMMLQQAIGASHPLHFGTLCKPFS